MSARLSPSSDPVSGNAATAFITVASGIWMHLRVRRNPCGLPCLRLAMMTFLLIAHGCATTDRTYLEQASRVAEIEGFQNIRVDGDASPSNASEWIAQTEAKDVNILCISGGGSGGAFTVGVLSGWTELGTRPGFDVVTGVSTGALIAPYAFLGPRYDRKLADLYTGGKAGDLIDFNWKGAGLFSASLLQGRALREMVERHIHADILGQIAAEHRKGRRLFVMTTNLDTQKAVIWNMGAIANSGRTDALSLFQDVMVASASIPGVFPAVLIKARSGNAMIEEMHSDGGSSSQLFSLPDTVMSAPDERKPPETSKRLHIYVIVNNALIPEFAIPANRTLSVMGRAYAVLIKSQTKQALLALYNYAQRTGIAFKVASIERQVPYSMLDPFNLDYMQRLYTLGLQGTLDGSLWKDRPVFR